MLSNQWLNEIAAPVCSPCSPAKSGRDTGFSNENQPCSTVAFVAQKNHIGGKPFSENAVNFAEENRLSDLPLAVYRNSDERPEPPHEVYEIPASEGQVCCAECAHGRQALNATAYGWRLCDAGQGGRFAMALHYCEKWEARP